MITPGEIGLVLLMVALWIFDAFVWVTTYISYRDLDEWGDIEDYAMVVIVGAVSVALTLFLALLTLCAVGIVE